MNWFLHVLQRRPVNFFSFSFFKYYHEPLYLSGLNVCQSVAIIILVSDQSLGLAASSSWLLSPLTWLQWSLKAILFFGMTRCFGHILYIFCLRPGISHFAREFCSFLGTWYLETTVYILGLLTQIFSLSFLFLFFFSFFGHAAQLVGS